MWITRCGSRVEPFVESESSKEREMELQVTEADKTRLESLEKVVEHGRKKQREGYAALKEIRDSKLYKAAGYETFESYCKEVWQITKQRVYQIIDFVEMTKRLSESIDVSDLHEACVRPLVGMDEESAAEVIEKARDLAVDEGKQSVTTSLMKKAAKTLSSPPPEPKKSTQVDFSDVAPSGDPVSGDEAKKCAKRALEALAKFKKNAGQVGLLGPQFESFLNLMEDRLEQML